MPELLFKGKEFVFNHHLAVPHRPLVPDADRSVGEPRLDGNLVINGDNLHALKSLLPMYAGKIDCIFIDPPYNTGNEGWCYNDNVNSPMMQQWLSENPVGIEDGLRHDKWCAMMWPRLRLLHELLSEAGSIWITLDDNEVHRSRMMLDTIFGEQNFVAQMIWKSRKSEDSRALTGISTDHEYVLCYAKSIGFCVSGVGINEDKFSNPDNDERGPWRSADMTGLATIDQRPNLHYPITNPDTRNTYPAPERGWRFEPSEMARKIQKNQILWPSSPNGRPRQKLFLSELKRTTKNISSVITAVTTGEGSKEIENIFGNRVFDFPKPSRLIQLLIEQTTNEHSIILDSFAGSGTTAHAVLAANTKDGGDRKFILVECEEYADSLTAERVRRVINGYSFQGTQREELMRKSITFSDLKKADKLLHQIAGVENIESHRFDKIEKKVKDGELVVEGVKAVIERVEGLGGSFTYCTLGEAIDMDRMLTGESLPEFSQLGALLFHMATNEAIDPGTIAIGDDGHGYLGESSAFHVWLIYKPDLEFLKSRDSALTLSKAKAFTAAKPEGKRHLVFAPAKFVSQKVLDEEKVPVEFAPLPWALYRIERS